MGETSICETIHHIGEIRRDVICIPRWRVSFSSIFSCGNTQHCSVEFHPVWHSTHEPTRSFDDIRDTCNPIVLHSHAIAVEFEHVLIKSTKGRGLLATQTEFSGSCLR